MYQVKDIVAVFGESLSEDVLKRNHPKANLNENLSIMNSNDFADSAMPVICEVASLLDYGKEIIMVVKPVANPTNSIAVAKPFVVSSKQVRLLERDGKVITRNKAKYIGVGTDSDYSSISSSLGSLLDNAREHFSVDEDHELDGLIRVYKGVEIYDWY